MTDEEKKIALAYARTKIAAMRRAIDQKEEELRHMKEALRLEQLRVTLFTMKVSVS